MSTDHEALSEIFMSHQRIPSALDDGTKRCTGLACNSLRGETDGPNSPRHAWHLADEVLDSDWLRNLKADLWDEAAEATAEWVANNPYPSGIPVDPPRNPYRVTEETT